jgi:iron complex transport system permease protein
VSNDAPAAGRHGATAESAVSTRGSELAIQSCLALLLLAAAFVSLTMGRFPIAIGDIATLVVSWVGIGPGRAGVSEPVWRVIELVRVPRILVATFVGAGLAVSGAVLQGIFRNPLVDPHIIGVSSGAAFGGVLAILFGLGAAILWSMAFAFGLAAVLLVIVVSRKAGRTSILMCCWPASSSRRCSPPWSHWQPISPIPTIRCRQLFLADGLLRQRHACASAPDVADHHGFIMPLLLIRFRLNVLSLGEEEVQGLGIRVEPTRWRSLTGRSSFTGRKGARKGRSARCLSKKNWLTSTASP